MPDAVQFVCQSCRDEEIPEWLDSVRQEIQAGYVYVCYTGVFLVMDALDICMILSIWPMRPDCMFSILIVCKFIPNPQFEVRLTIFIAVIWQTHC